MHSKWVTSDNGCISLYPDNSDYQDFRGQFRQNVKRKVWRFERKLHNDVGLCRWLYLINNTNNVNALQSWVACGLGISMIGTLVISHAVMSSFMSFVSGRLAKITGRIPIFLAGRSRITIKKAGHVDLFFDFMVFEALKICGDRIVILETSTNI